MHIVLAVNPEADQPWVADAAAGLARQTGGSVTVVSVDEVELERLAALPRAAYLERAEAAATAATDRLAAAGIAVDKAVLSGPAVDRITELADERNADLIIVGASTHGAVHERLLGSVPMTLVRRSRRPVVVVTPPQIS